MDLSYSQYHHSYLHEDVHQLDIIHQMESNSTYLQDSQAFDLHPYLQIAYLTQKLNTWQFQFLNLTLI